MTDPETADRTYIEPITVESVEKVIEIERPDALLPNMGGQTGLNCAVALAKAGVLDRYGVEVIGCDVDSIETGEDRKLFADAMRDIGLEVAKSDVAHSIEECERIADDLGYPVVIRPAFTLGGAGGGMFHFAWKEDCELGILFSVCYDGKAMRESCGRGGTGRRAGFRFQWEKFREGSSPFARTIAWVRSPPSER